MPGIDSVGEIAEPVPQGNIAVDIAAQMSDRRVPDIRGINASWKQGEGVEEVLVLGVVIETYRGFAFATANAEPAFEAVIRDGKVQRGMVLSELAEVAVVKLSSHSELVVDAGGSIDPEVP
jgi:hypothetical protein